MAGTTRLRTGLVAVAVLVAAPAAMPDGVRAQRLDPIVYTLRVPAPETHYAEIEAIVPTGRRAAIDLMMPIGSPGYYREEQYADQVDNVRALARDGAALEVEKPQRNRWRVHTGGRPSIVLSYRVFCNQRSVTTNFVGEDYGVFNGAPTFITLVESARRPHEVRIALPSNWTRAMTGLETVRGGAPTRFRARDYETLVDSPIMAGKLGVREFSVAGKPHSVVSAGDVAGWDADAATRDLATFVGEVQRFWGFLPYDKYVFLLVFRQGGGGLEHKNSTLSTVAARPGPGMWQGIGLLSHEYFHLFNVKRLRPVGLGPFDFERPPRTGSLWIAEGVTSYYSALLVERAGLRTRDQYLTSVSSLINQLQSSQGRLQQSVEQSSLEVWNNSNSGVNPAASTVSYYNKGNVLGLLLDARIRRLTQGRRSFDDVMKLAYRRYSGARGFTADEFRATAEEIAGADLTEWFRRAVSSTEELQYDDLLECYGLRFATSEQPSGNWTLVVRDDASDVQKRNIEAWLAPAAGR
jgi:predicted metalloprotease with PDZ domain